MKDVFPGIFCLEDIQCAPCDTAGFNYRATLYHDQACITVSFNCNEFDPSLETGQLVSVRWLPVTQSTQGAIQVGGLTALKVSAKNINPENFNQFPNMPHTFKSVDRHLSNCARNLWHISSKEMRQMLFATVLTQAGHPDWKTTR
ncbi:MAG: hypothetical protein PHP70_05825 [Gallionella sp.]|nr:hypothetical protein [Gallionella sp.]